MFSFNISKVNFEEELGEGAHGTVYAYNQKTSKDDQYVVKRITTPKVDIMLSSMQEIVLGFNCDHPHVLPIKGYHIGFDKESKLWNIYMKMPRMVTSLKEKINKYAREGKSFTEEEIINYLYTLTIGLRYLHEKRIAHRDIKPDNILIDENGQLKIADIGIGQLIEDDNTEMLTQALGTLLYTAPEVLTDANKLKKKGLFVADVWSLGVIMAEICVPKTRLISANTSGKDNETNLNQILNTLEGKYSKVLLNLISGTIRADPQERISLVELQRVLEENFSEILDLSQDAKEREAALQKENEILKLYTQQLQNQINQMEEEMKSLTVLTPDINKNFFPMKEEELGAHLGSENLLNIKNDKQKEIGDKTPQKTPFQFEFQGDCPKTLIGHTLSVYCLQTLSNDEVASGSGDKTIRIWNTSTGNCVKILTGHTEAVRCLYLLQTGELVSGSLDKTIKIWDLKKYNCLQTLTGHTDMVRCLQTLPTGELVSGSFDSTIKFWNMRYGKCLNTLEGHASSVYCLKLLSGEELVSASKDKTIKIWNLKTNSCLKTLKGHGDVVRYLEVLPTGEIVSGSNDRTIRLWDVKTESCIKILKGHTNLVCYIQLLPTGNLVSGSDDKTIKIWDVKSGNCIKTLQGHTGFIHYLQALPTGELVSGSQDKTIKIWK